MTKVIAFYLPQFHDIPENDEWWGKGFTEWTNVKAAHPLFEGHEQPRVPLGNKYYNLLDDTVKVWQAKIAREHGIYGFCYYHYWFGGKMLLQKPMEQMLANKNIDIPFCVCWANEPWTKAWVNETKVLIPQKYGDESEWKRHFDYLLPFLLDERYITEDGCPLVVIYRPEVIPRLNEMLSLWNSLAVEKGLPGLVFAYQQVVRDWAGGSDEAFRYHIEYQPSIAMMRSLGMLPSSLSPFENRSHALRALKNRVSTVVEKALGIDVSQKLASLRKAGRDAPQLFDYDELWSQILNNPPLTEKSIPGAFVDWDNTPRKGVKGDVVLGGTPEKFERYFSELLEKSRREYGSPFVFVNAWNEWAEGTYLEPDETWGLGYLKAIRSALNQQIAYDCSRDESSKNLLGEKGYDE